MKNLLQQFITFCGVGVINTVVGLAVILFLSEILHMHYVAANVGGYAVGLIASFILNRRVTFSATDRTPYEQMLPFLAVFAVAYLCQLGLLMLLVGKLSLPNVLGQVIACAAYTILNFAGNRWITFRQ